MLLRYFLGFRFFAQETQKRKLLILPLKTKCCMKPELNKFYFNVPSYFKENFRGKVMRGLADMRYFADIPT